MAGGHFHSSSLLLKSDRKRLLWTDALKYSMRTMRFLFPNFTIRANVRGRNAVGENVAAWIGTTNTRYDNGLNNRRCRKEKG